MSRPSWAPPRKEGESEKSYQKRYYTAQRVHAEKTGDTATTDKIKSKLPKTSKSTKVIGKVSSKSSKSKRESSVAASNSSKEKAAASATRGGGFSLPSMGGGKTKTRVDPPKGTMTSSAGEKSYAKSKPGAVTGVSMSVSKPRVSEAEVARRNKDFEDAVASRRKKAAS
jgi:hypothetical protein